MRDSSFSSEPDSEDRSLVRLFSSPECDESVKSAPMPLLDGLGLRSLSLKLKLGSFVDGLPGGRNGRAAKTYNELLFTTFGI